MTSIARPTTTSASETLIDFIERHRRLFVLTGAGCSTDSGIPDYRDADGEWKRGRPIMLQDFLANERARRRYWARSLVGWRRMRGAVPNGAHRALASLERRGRIELLVTQNVDGLHQAAGSSRVIDLHGRIDVVFFGEGVPGDRMRLAMAALDASDAMLIVGSSLMVYSGYRFAKAAADAGKPLGAVNLGRTRADDSLTLKIASRCADALSFLL